MNSSVFTLKLGNRLGPIFQGSLFELLSDTAASTMTKTRRRRLDPKKILQWRNLVWMTLLFPAPIHDTDDLVTITKGNYLAVAVRQIKALSIVFEFQRYHSRFALSEPRLSVNWSLTSEAGRPASRVKFDARARRKITRLPDEQEWGGGVLLRRGPLTSSELSFQSCCCLNSRTGRAQIYTTCS